MKMHGKKIEGLNVEIVVIPRTEGEDIVFKCGPVLDFDEFDKMCPEPKPPSRVVKGGAKEYNLKDKTFLAACETHGQRKIDWIILKSLSFTEWLEWETVDLGNHRTWHNFRKELKDAGLSHFETQRIINAVFAANGLSEARVQEARDAFQRGQEESPDQPSGPSTEQLSTSSGTPASAGE